MIAVKPTPLYAKPLCHLVQSIDGIRNANQMAHPVANENHGVKNFNASRQTRHLDNQQERGLGRGLSGEV